MVDSFVDVGVGVHWDIEYIYFLGFVTNKNLFSDYNQLSRPILTEREKGRNWGVEVDKR